MPDCAYTNRILNKPRALNKQSFEYGRVLTMRALHSVLNLPEYSEYEYDF